VMRQSNSERLSCPVKNEFVQVEQRDGRDWREEREARSGLAGPFAVPVTTAWPVGAVWTI
jgi:hypothetical protein